MSFISTTPITTTSSTGLVFNTNTIINDLQSLPTSASAITEAFQHSVANTANYFSHEKCLKDCYHYLKKLLTSPILLVIWSSTYYNGYVIKRNIPNTPTLSIGLEDDNISELNPQKTSPTAVPPTNSDASLALDDKSLSTLAIETTSPPQPVPTSFQQYQAQIGLFIPRAFIDWAQSIAPPIHVPPVGPSTASILSQQPSTRRNELIQQLYMRERFVNATNNTTTVHTTTPQVPDSPTSITPSTRTTPLQPSPQTSIDPNMLRNTLERTPPQVASQSKSTVVGAKKSTNNHFGHPQ
jgi:hypothetical protein